MGRRRHQIFRAPLATAFLISNFNENMKDTLVLACCFSLFVMQSVTRGHQVRTLGLRATGRAEFRRLQVWSENDDRHFDTPVRTTGSDAPPAQENDIQGPKDGDASNITSASQDNNLPPDIEDFIQGRQSKFEPGDSNGTLVGVLSGLMIFSLLLCCFIVIIFFYVRRRREEIEQAERASAVGEEACVITNEKCPKPVAPESVLTGDDEVALVPPRLLGESYDMKTLDLSQNSASYEEELPGFAVEQVEFASDDAQQQISPKIVASGGTHQKKVEAIGEFPPVKTGNPVDKKGLLQKIAQAKEHSIREWLKLCGSVPSMPPPSSVEEGHNHCVSDMDESIYTLGEHNQKSPQQCDSTDSSI